MISPMMPRRVCKNWWGEDGGDGAGGYSIFFSPGWGWLTCDIDVVWKFEGDLSFHGRRAIPRNPMAISKKNNDKKTQNEFLKEKQQLQKARVFSTLQWELASFSLRGFSTAPLGSKAVDHRCCCATGARPQGGGRKSFIFELFLDMAYNIHFPSNV